MSFNDSNMILFLAVAFVVVGVGASVVYYFFRYFLKTGEQDSEVIEKLRTKDQKKTMNEALQRTRENLWGRLSVIAGGEITSDIRNQIEEVLLTSDLGPRTAELLFRSIDEKLSRGEKKNARDVKEALRGKMESILNSAQTARADELFARAEKLPKPVVWMMVGVNGAGKTTTIGKFAAIGRARGWSVMVAAGDTFRAAADQQLKSWAERAGATIFSPENTKDPAAVAHMALEKAKADNIDLVLVDTAGRLHTQGHLMEELRKTKRVMAKVNSEAPHEVLLTVDANSGQNALTQAKEFHAALGLTGIVVSKLDGSAKGGVLVGIAHELKIPICYVGVGEGLNDLKPFDPHEFVESIL